MRRSHGGWLAALALLLGGCGAGPAGDDAAPVGPDEVVVPTVPVVARAVAPPPGPDELTVLVSSAGGVGSPALDALATVLDARPDMVAVVVATAARNDTTDETGGRSALIDGTTAGGFPARAVNASAADAVAAGLAAHRGVDLVVVGIDDEPAVGDGVDRSPAVAAARVAHDRDVPAIAVTAGDDAGLDLSAAVLALQQVLDLHLDALLTRGGIGVVTVPSCATGTVRPLVEVDAGRGAAAVADCTAAPVEPGDDVEAHAAGYATFTRLPR